MENAKNEKRRDSVTSSVTSSRSSRDRYGFLSWTPRFLQVGNNAKGFLACYSCFVIVQGMLVNGFVNVGISSIEKRFGLKSSQTGVVAVGYDIAFCVCTLFVTYAWSRSHRPRIVACGCLTMAVGAIVFTLPHFTTGLYEYSSNFTETCSSGETSEECGASDGTNLFNYLYVFLLGQLLHGMGCTPLYTLGLSFIEDSVPKESASLYLGIANGASIFGPVLGYGLGGVFLGYYVDFDVVDVANDVSITSSDPRWVGAWWLGIALSAVLALVIAIPIFGFPKKFRESEEYQRARVSEVHNDERNHVTKDSDFGKSFRDFPKALMLLLRNPTYVFVSLAGASEAMLIAGFTTFLPKIIENQFQQTAGAAALVAGVISIPGGVLGHILAGLVVKGLRLKTASILKLNCLYCLLVICGAPTLFLYCQNRSIAGITVPYSNYTNTGGLAASCNVDCNCQREYFIAVCGDDNVTYFTACQAGCTDFYEDKEGNTVFSNCACLETATREAVSGTCEEDCGTLPTFLGIFFVVVMFTFMSSTPSLVVTFRVVPEELRSFALGMQWLVIRALGSIPGPIMFGTVIDAVCLLWQQKTCDGTQGSCWVYDSDKLTINVLIICIVVKSVSVVLFSTACYLYKPPPMKDVDDKPRIESRTVSTSSGGVDNEVFEQTTDL